MVTGVDFDTILVMLYVLMALFPLLVLITLIVVLKRSVVVAASAALVSIVAVGAIGWGLTWERLASAIVKGGFVATEIILIVAGALLIIELLERRGLLTSLRGVFSHITHDYRVITLIVALALVQFLEGAAGFGTPALVAVPLLMILGFKPLHAVILALVGDSVPVIFGAIGLPVTYGIGSAVATADNPQSIITGVTQLSAWLNVAGYIMLALLLTAIAVRLRKEPWQRFIAFAPVAVAAGLAVSLPAVAVAYTLGPELPSLIGGLVGMVLIAVVARLYHKRILAKKQQQAEQANMRMLGLALLPYALLIGLLVITRLPGLPVGGWLQNIAWRQDWLFGEYIAYSFAPFYSVVGILAIVGLLSAIIMKLRGKEIAAVVKSIATRLARPYLALLAVLAFVQVFIYSGDNLQGLASMPVVIATSLSNATGGFWPLFAPLVGAVGSFVAGSATVSNLLFAGLQYDIAVTSAYNPMVLLTLQGLGAAAGNMVALHNIIAALVVARLAHAHTGKVIRYTVWPLLALLVLYGLAGLLLA